jgi:hypothetical protein
MESSSARSEEKSMEFLRIKLLHYKSQKSRKSPTLSEYKYRKEVDRDNFYVGSDYKKVENNGELGLRGDADLFGYHIETFEALENTYYAIGHIKDPEMRKIMVDNFNRIVGNIRESNSDYAPQKAMNISFAKKSEIAPITDQKQREKIYDESGSKERFTEAVHKKPLPRIVDEAVESHPLESVRNSLVNYKEATHLKSLVSETLAIQDLDHDLEFDNPKTKKDVEGIVLYEMMKHPDAESGIPDLDEKAEEKISSMKPDPVTGKMPRHAFVKEIDDAKADVKRYATNFHDDLIMTMERDKKEFKAKESIKKEQISKEYDFLEKKLGMSKLVEEPKRFEEEIHKPRRSVKHKTTDRSRSPARPKTASIESARPLSPWKLGREEVKKAKHGASINH